MQGSHAWRGDSAVFDEDDLVSHAGLVPLMELAEQAGLSWLLDEHVRFTSERRCIRPDSLATDTHRNNWK